MISLCTNVARCIPPLTRTATIHVYERSKYYHVTGTTAIYRAGQITAEATSVRSVLSFCRKNRRPSAVLLYHVGTVLLAAAESLELEVTCGGKLCTEVHDAHSGGGGGGTAQ